jgi:hypothetical protein
MNREELYTWQTEVLQCFGCLSKWQALGLALLSYGVMVVGRCQMGAVAESLVLAGSYETVKRRLKRWLDNGGIDVSVCCVAWVRWVVGQVSEVVLLVDETALGVHVSVMLVGLAYHGRCIPLAWRCYHKAAYPAEGQVALIHGLLKVVAAGLPDGCCPLLQADRGIGTSPALIRVVKRLKWRFLFRVQRTTQLVTRRGRLWTLGQQPSGWSATGLAFSQRGRVRVTAFVYRAFGQTEPWCLLTNDPRLSVLAYALRAWQEQSFRDLKSGGWQWQHSHVWQPDHAERLLLALTLAYARMLTLAVHTLPDWPSVDPVTFIQRRHPARSVFQHGLAFFRRCLWSGLPTAIPFRLLAWPGFPSQLLC